MSVAALLHLAVVVAMFTLTIGLNTPQLLRLLRTGDASGLSVTSLLNGTVGYTAWLVYLFLGEQWLVLGATALGAAVWLWILGLAVARLSLHGRQVVAPAAWALLLAGLAVGDITVFGVVLALGVVWTYTPAAVSAWRAPRISGLSVVAWTLCLGEAVLWLGWGLATADPALAVYGVCAGLGAAVVLAAIGVRRDARATTLVALA